MVMNLHVPKQEREREIKRRSLSWIEAYENREISSPVTLSPFLGTMRRPKVFLNISTEALAACRIG
jgi:hypothetical protein